MAEGVPLEVTFTLVDVSGSGDAGTAVEGRRDLRLALRPRGSLLDVPVTFTTIFPACYSGRWPHIHFEVYPSLSDATSASNRLRTSQLALPQDVCETAYATSGYEQSVTSLAQSSLDSDMVFADGYSLQLATVSGSVAGGYVATLRVPV